MIKPVTAVFCLMGLCLITRAQAPAASSSSAESETNRAIEYFNKSIGQQAELFNGPEYIALPKATRGTPYWLNSDNFITGAVKYNGTWYNGIPLLYDVFKNKVVSIQPVNNYRFVLHSYLLSDFVVNGRHFVYVNEPDSVKQQLKPGYYELQYSGKSMVLCKHAKERTETTSMQGVEVVFDDKQSYYVVKNGKVYSVSGKGSVLNVFKDKKKELNSYLKEKDIDYNDNKVIAISAMAAYYDRITQ